MTEEMYKLVGEGKRIIFVTKSAHKTLNVTIYNMPSNTHERVVDWFELMDIWGSQGYNRYSDGGLFFELPIEMFDILPSLPFIKRLGITVFSN